MTFKEYLNQSDPQRQSGVIVTPDDCIRIYHSSRYTKINLMINNKLFCYAVNPNSSCLWTIDRDGNPVRRSCFLYEAN